MVRTHRIALMALLMAGMPTSTLTATQTNPCITTADRVDWLRRLTKNIYEGRDSTATVAQGFPWARYENVQGVSDSAVCVAGMTAYNDLLGFTGTPQAATQVVVLALGETGYALIPPEPRPKDKGRTMLYIFSPTWELKRKYLI